MKFPVLTALLFLVVACSTDANNDFADRPGNADSQNTAENRKNVGDAANDLLSAATFTSISFEMVYVEGFMPAQATIQNFEEFLQARLNKPGNIEVSLTAIESPGNAVYTIEDVRALEDQVRTTFNQGSTIAVFGLFLDGEYAENSENSSVLGVAYRNTSFVIFEETIQQFSNAPLAPGRTTLETTVINHEFGHLLGLVNAGTTMQTPHQDTAHGRHCTTDECLMYWTAETGEGLLNSLSGGTVPSLDDLCLADLRANGGK